MKLREVKQALKERDERLWKLYCKQEPSQIPADTLTIMVDVVYNYFNSEGGASGGFFNAMEDGEAIWELLNGYWKVNGSKCYCLHIFHKLKDGNLKYDVQVAINCNTLEIEIIKFWREIRFPTNKIHSWTLNKKELRAFQSCDPSAFTFATILSNIEAGFIGFIDATKTSFGRSIWGMFGSNYVKNNPQGEIPYVYVGTGKRLTKKESKNLTEELTR